MSLAKSVTLSSGVVVNFWTLNSLTLDAVAKVATLYMTGYLDSDGFTNGYDPAVIIPISVMFVPTNALPGGVSVLTALYAKTLLDPYFTDGIFTNDGY